MYRPSCSALEYGVLDGLGEPSVREAQVPAQQPDHALGEVDGRRLLGGRYEMIWYVSRDEEDENDLVM